MAFVAFIPFPLVRVRSALFALCILLLCLSLYVIRFVCKPFRPYLPRIPFVGVYFLFFFFAYIFLVFYIFQMSSDYADAVTFISAAYLAWFFEIFIFFTTYIAYPYSVRQVRVQVFKYVTAPASFAGADFVCTRPAFAFIIFSLQISFDVKYV